MPSALCDQGHPTNYANYKGFRLKNLKCEECGGDLHAAKTDTCFVCSPREPEHKYCSPRIYVVLKGVKTCPEGHPLGYDHERWDAWMEKWRGSRRI